MKPLSGERKNIAVRATSSGVPMRPTAMLLRMRSVCGAPSGLLWRNSSVAMGPGPMALTVIPSRPSSMASVRVMPIIPALVAE